ncbi:MAG: ABC transporter ATP-binding protein [Halobacteriaceae archaeon]
MDPVVARDLSHSYGDLRALDSVSLSAPAGQILGLIGPNGAGKTTLIRCLTGTLSPDTGRVHLLGMDPTAVDRNRIGLLPQSFTPPERLTARELVTYYAGLYDEARDPDEVLADVGIASHRDTWYGQLSGGQRRRVCVATALVNDPEVLFLDEPTTGIDPAGRRAIWELIETLRDRGRSIVLTTHDMAEAGRLGDEVVLLAEGRVVASGPPAQLVAEHGGPSRLVIETGADSAAVEQVLDEYSASAAGSAVAIEGVTPDGIGAVVRALDAAAIDFDAIHWQEPTLEDVYLELTDAQRRQVQGRP